MGSNSELTLRYFNVFCASFDPISSCPTYLDRKSNSESPVDVSSFELVCARFSSAGVGNFVQTLIMVILLAAFSQTGTTAQLSPHRLEIVWRLQYALVGVVLAVLTW